MTDGFALVFLLAFRHYPSTMNTITRRHFLRNTIIGTAVLTRVPGILVGADPDRKVKLGLIGCGWYGMVDVEAAFKAGNVEVVALCDVDSEHLTQSAEKVEKLQGNRPRTFKLYQDMLAVDGLDAVIIGTPPHWHALQLITALERKLDIYCEKPLAYDIRECRVMVDAVKKTDRIVQIGFQRRQSPAFQAVRKYIQEGKAGKIVCAEANIHFTAGTKDPTPQEPPASLDWELWCGPAPKIPYSPQVGHKNWRLEKTTGHGHLVSYWGNPLRGQCLHVVASTISRAGLPRQMCLRHILNSASAR